MKLSSKLQVWVPIELMSVVQSLWARAQPDDVEREGETFHAHEIRIWSLFLLAIHQTKPKYASAPESMRRQWRQTRAHPDTRDTTQYCRRAGFAVAFPGIARLPSPHRVR